MKYKEILDNLEMYSIIKEDIIKRRGYDQILENVVVAPWWDHTLFSNYSSSIRQVGEKVYNVFGEDFSFSFIEIKNIGASALLEEVFALGVTSCKKILFIGSAGALDESIKIGDLAIPLYSHNGVGATRYLNESLKDDFEEKYYSNQLLNDRLMDIIKRMGYEVRLVENYSVDTIIAQFSHIDHIRDLKAKTIEMETSTLFKCCDMMGIDATALFVISDNTIKNKSLYNGRNEEDSKRKKKVRDEIVPLVVVELLKS